MEEGSGLAGASCGGTDFSIPWLGPCTVLVALIPRPLFPPIANLLQVPWTPSQGLPEKLSITAKLLISHFDYETHCHDLLSLTQVCM